MKRTINLIPLLTVGTLVNLIGLVGTFSYFLRARIILGRWPYYGNPDPKDMHLLIHDMIATFSFFASYLYVLIALITFIWHLNLIFDRKLIIPLVGYLVSFLICVTFYTQTNVIDWLMD